MKINLIIQEVNLASKVQCTITCDAHTVCNLEL